MSGRLPNAAEAAGLIACVTLSWILLFGAVALIQAALALLCGVAALPAARVVVRR